MADDTRTAHILIRLRELLPQAHIDQLQAIAEGTGYPLDEVVRRIVDKGLEEASPHHWWPYPEGRGEQPHPRYAL